MGLVTLYYKIEHKLLEWTTPLSDYVNKTFDLHWTPNYYLHALVGFVIGAIVATVSYLATNRIIPSIVFASIVVLAIAALKEYVDGQTGLGSRNIVTLIITAVFGIIGSLVILVKK